MASNRGPNAIGSTPTPNSFSAAVPVSAPAAPAMANHQNSEYYKARNAQGGPSFSWAASGVGIGGPPVSPPSSAPPAPPLAVGGSWASAPVAPRPHATSVAARSRAAAHGHGSVASAVPITNGTTGGARPGGAYEANLIAELCPPGGMKAEPPADKLDEFARAIPSLNPDLVCPALLDALEEGNPWIMRAKALCVIETVLNVEAGQENGGASNNAYTDFFHECAGEIEPLRNHARASVKGPAKRVLMALGIDNGTIMNGAAAAFAAPAAAVAAPVAPPLNLLDFDEPAAPVPVAASPAVVGSSAPSGGGALFSGLNTKAATSAPQQPSAAAPVASPPSVAQQQQQQQGDFFGGTAINSTPVANSGSSNDLFGNMTVKSANEQVKVELVTSNAASEPPSSAAAAPGSAFGFMNATPTSPVPPPPAQVTPAPPSPKSFDPLLSMGMMPGNTNNITNNTPISSPNPNNNNQMAQMQQMQMAYQQNMMMMQQKMQQLQMANYGRQGSGGGGAGGVPPLPMPGAATTSSKQPIMGANYMRQVPGVSGDTLSSFSFLGASDPKKKQDNHSFDFVMDAMKNEKK